MGLFDKLFKNGKAENHKHVKENLNSSPDNREYWAENDNHSNVDTAKYEDSGMVVEFSYEPDSKTLYDRVDCDTDEDLALLSSAKSTEALQENESKENALVLSNDNNDKRNVFSKTTEEKEKIHPIVEAKENNFSKKALDKTTKQQTSIENKTTTTSVEAKKIKTNRFSALELATERLRKACEPLRTANVLQVEKSSNPSPKQIVPEGKITGKFEIKKSSDGRFMFNLLSSNHLVIATSQMYSSLSAAMTGINSIIANAPKAGIEDLTVKNPETTSFPKWVIHTDHENEYYFTLYALNGSAITHSQSYTTKVNCKKGIESVIRSSSNAVIDKVYLDK